MNKDDYEDVFKKYLDSSWKFANYYNNYSNELELYNKIRCDKNDLLELDRDDEIDEWLLPIKCER